MNTSWNIPGIFSIWIINILIFVIYRQVQTFRNFKFLQTYCQEQVKIPVKIIYKPSHFADS